MASRALTIASFMTRVVHTVPMETSLPHARSLMEKHRVRHLPVVDGEKLVGVLSERDLGRLEGFPMVNLNLVSVPDAMSEVPYVVAPTTPLLEVLQNMHEHRYGSVVVVENDHIVGIFTTIDALSLLIESLTVTAPPNGH